MKNTTLPSKYAEALFKAAKEQSVIEKVKQDLEAINEFIDGSPELTKVMNHPGINRATKCAVIRSQFGDTICRLAKNFVFMLIDRKRENILKDVSKIYSEKVDEYFGIKSVEVKTVFELSDKEQKQLTQKLEKVFNKKIKLSAKTDEGIMGGVIIRDKMTLIDASVRQYLDTMKRILKEKKVLRKKNADKKKTIKKKKTK